MSRAPSSLAAQLEVERRLDVRRHRYVIGVDEVGRGSWAGPLCVGAAAFDLRRLIDFISGLHDAASGSRGADSPLSPAANLDYLRVDDSKKLNARLRGRLVEPIKDLASGFGIGMVGPAELDEIGMAASLRLACGRALNAMGELAGSSLLLLDGTVNFSSRSDVLTVVKGDSKSFSIASASILAKVARDSHMESESENYPWYGFEKNKGYPSQFHVSALHALGPSHVHRKSWSYVDKLPWGKKSGGLFGSPRYPSGKSLFD